MLFGPKNEINVLKCNIFGIKNLWKFTKNKILLSVKCNENKTNENYAQKN